MIHAGVLNGHGGMSMFNWGITYTNHSGMQMTMTIEETSNQEEWALFDWDTISDDEIQLIGICLLTDSGLLIVFVRSGT